jgi:hypothetical protein
VMLVHSDDDLVLPFLNARKDIISKALIFVSMNRKIHPIPARGYNRRPKTAVFI